MCGTWNLNVKLQYICISSNGSGLWNWLIGCAEIGVDHASWIEEIDTFGIFSIYFFFYKRDSFYGFLFALLQKTSFWRRVCSKRKWANYYLLVYTPFQKGNKSKLEEVLPPKRVYITLLLLYTSPKEIILTWKHLPHFWKRAIPKEIISHLGAKSVQ